MRYFEFSLTDPRLAAVRFVLCRESITVNGDIESAFLGQIDGVQRHPRVASFQHAFGAALTAPDATIIALIRNPALVLDAELPDRLCRAIAALPDNDRWALAGAGGLAPGGQRYLALYSSATPTLPDQCAIHPLVDAMPDLCLVNADFARRLFDDAPALPIAGLEPILATAGYLDHRVSLFLPQLSAGIDGNLATRDAGRMGEDLGAHFGATLAGQQIATLAGPVTIEQPADQTKPAPPEIRDLSAAIAQVLATHADPPGLSIITRTRFERPHLLRRLLTSISRARRDDMALEVILSSDADPAICDAEMAQLTEAFGNLDLRLRRNPDAEPSRVGNLLGGLEAAKLDYVAIIDDDDYVDLFAFDALGPAFFGGNRPVIVTTAEVHNETWEETPSGRAVLSQSVPAQSYPATGWRTMFDGVNRLPICALILPRDRLMARLATFDLCHDLSEDYAVYLLVLTDPELPALHEIADIFCHISLRETGNSVTMADRRPWVRDIAGYLTKLTGSAQVAGPGLWQLLRNTGAGQATENPALGDLRQALDRRESELRLLRRENARLRSETANHYEPAI